MDSRLGQIGQSSRYRRVVARLRQRLSRISHRQPLVWLAAAAAIGILASDLTSLSPGIAFVALLGVLVPYRFASLNQRRWLVIGFMIALFALRHGAARQAYEAATLVPFLDTEDRPMIVEAVIDSPAILQPHPLAGYESKRDLSPWQTEMEGRVERIRVGDDMKIVTGRILIVIDGECDHHLPGERLRLFGKISAPRASTNPGERDVRVSYQQRGVHARMTIVSDDQIEVLAPASWSLQGFFAQAAAFSRATLLNATEASNGGIAVALVVGQRDFVDPATSDLLLVTGTAHMLSVSGLHLAIVVLIARWIGLTLRLAPSTQLVWIIAISLFYAAVTGGRPPVLRASILVGLFVLSIVLRRQSQPLNTLSLAALLLLFWKPDLLFNTGVQLSFLAVATLIVCGRRLTEDETPLDRLREQDERVLALANQSLPWSVRLAQRSWEWLRQAFRYSLCVTMISLPVVWHQFHVVSLVSVFANICLSLPLMVALASGIATVLAALIWEPLAIVPGFVCDRSLWLMMLLIRYCGELRYGHAWLPSPPTLWVILFYAVVVLSLLLVPTRRVRWFRYGWIACWMVSAWIMATRPPAIDVGTVEATFVDVGHGTGIVLRFSPRDVWLYDCGRLGNSIGSTANMDEVLWRLGVTRLSGIMISHADSDHYNALPAILKRFRVDSIRAPAMVFRDTDPLLRSLRQLIDELGIPLVNTHAGVRWEINGISVEALHPPTERIRGSDNANSLVVVIGTSPPIVLPGDVEPPGVETLIRQPRPNPGGVLMAPHHGSMQMDVRPVLDWARPSAVVVSGGERAAREEVQAALSERGAITLVTAKLGAIRLRIDQAGSLEIKSWLSDPW